MMSTIAFKKYWFYLLQIMLNVTRSFFILLFTCVFVTCNSGKPSVNKTLFSLIPSAVSGVHFSNTLSYTESFNPYTFRNFFNGGGVALGDINNDGLVDIFFCSNQHSNQLYLNKGNFTFQDITLSAGLTTDSVWSTGVTMADVNGDGLLDIYVCKSGDMKAKNRTNQLFINTGNLTFIDKAKEFGLDNRGLSTHAVFFDFDNDGGNFFFNKIVHLFAGAV